MNWLTQGRNPEPLPTPDPVKYAFGVVQGALGQVADVCNSGVIRVNDPNFGVRYDQVELTKEQEEELESLLASLAWIIHDKEKQNASDGTR